MKFKSVSPWWWPLCLLALSGAARADLEPYSLGASETVEHQTNVTRAADADRVAGWLSVTEFNAALDQALGRDRLTATAAFDVNRYSGKELHDLDANTYNLAGAFDWSTVGDLSGAIGADSRRRQYFYGLDGDIPGATASTTLRNLETDNHVFANAQLGGLARWTLFAGVDANQRNYSNSAFDANEQRQWSTNAGTRYATSPDLSFGLTGSVTHGNYPHFVLASGARDDFELRSLDLTTKWQVSGNSAMDASVGYTDADYTEQPASKFVNGSLNWNWTPPSHISVSLGLSRNSDSDTAVTGTLVNNNLAGRSINNVGHILVTYAFSAKTSLVANAQYTQRRYSNDVLPVTNPDGTVTTINIDGTNRTAQFGLAAHFQPTRTADLSCSVQREIRRSDAQIATITPSYTDNTVLCSAAIKFD
jgi:hypothetical protein